MKIIKSTKGFILPTVVMLSFIFCIIIFHYALLYTNDLQFLSETENNLFHNTLLQMASIDSIELVENTGTIEEQTGMMKYETGVVRYQIIPIESETAYIYLRSKTKKAGERMVSFHYDKKEKAVSDWLEGIE